MFKSDFLLQFICTYFFMFDGCVVDLPNNCFNLTFSSSYIFCDVFVCQSMCKIQLIASLRVSCCNSVLRFYIFFGYLLFAQTCSLTFFTNIVMTI